MIQVTKEEFYKKVMHLDAVVSTEGNYPYTSVFSRRHGGVIGKAVDRYATEKDEPTQFETVTDYFLIQP
jgi:hypothetical protein